MADDRTVALGPRQETAQAEREPSPPARVGDWHIVRAIAVGGFGTVYEARHDTTPQRVALKLMHARFATSAEMRARFDREVRVLRSLGHPNVVEFVDAGFSADGHPYLCMELIEGEELRTRLARDGRLALPMALAIIEPLCDALAAAHERGIVHRDLKASNVMLGRAPAGRELGRIVLLDFGIAKLADALAPELTASNQSLGTPMSMAPEQILSGAIDGRTDVYALGCLLFHLITGRPPFEDPSSMMTQYLHLHARRPRASKCDGVAPQLDDVIVRAMAIEPGDRFADVHALLAAARTAVHQGGTSDVVVEDAIALLVTVTDRTGGTAIDVALVDDLEGVLPAAERLLGTLGFSLALDLGSSAVFVAPRTAVPDPVAIATSVLDQLDVRPGRDPRVAVALCLHADRAPFSGSELQPCPLLRVATWHAPDLLEGLWVSRALAPDAPDGRHVR